MNFFVCHLVDRLQVSALSLYLLARRGFAGWQVQRRLDGTIIEDPVRFPSGMKALADYVHSKGLKFGLCIMLRCAVSYCAVFSSECLGKSIVTNADFVLSMSADTARGVTTCQKRPGAAMHELIDAKTYCNWGLDYLKIVGGADIFNRTSITQCPILPANCLPRWHAFSFAIFLLSAC